MSITNCYIYGASGHGKVVLDCLVANNIKCHAFIDDEIKNAFVCSHPIYNVKVINDQDFVIFGVGDNKTRKHLDLKYRFRTISLTHPSALISRHAKIGSGTVVFHNCVVQSSVVIGKHVIINTSASVDHDCIIEDYVHISPNATLCGGVTIGEGTHIGAAAVIIPGIKIGRWVTIGAGAVVIRDVPDYAVVVGNPGKIIRYNEKVFLQGMP